MTGTGTPRDVAPDDWDAHWEDFAEAAARNPAQAFRRRIVLAHLARAGTPRRYLDIGSGQGDLAVAVAERWGEAEIAGIELSERGVAIARGKLPRGRFVQFDLLSGRPPVDHMAGWATHATCSEVIEHVDEPRAFLAAARRWLAPGAVLVVTVPGGPMSAFDRHVGHRRHYTQASLTAVLEEAGLAVDVCGGAGFPFFDLYRRTVIARGARLVDDVDSDGPMSPVARAAMAVFDGLLTISPPRGRRGWQLYALATAPDESP
ncbi:MAG TPA: class I SAM-dependent methyltransferase [Acidimicrobiales bacterium]|nr:class I SAM-dependent methyltransferase [Acidimicrobiales bacterium]